jgi:hypothetical protein
MMPDVPDEFSLVKRLSWAALLLLLPAEAVAVVAEVLDQTPEVRMGRRYPLLLDHNGKVIPSSKKIACFA